jgi:hypothetical protein
MVTTSDINTTNTIDICNLSTDDHLYSTIEDATNNDKSHNSSDQHTNADIDTSNNQSSYTPPPDENTFFDPTDSTNSAYPYTPTNDAHDTTHDINHPSPQTTKAVTSLRQLDISTFATQNTHGLRRIPRDTDGKILPTEPYDYTR